MSDTHDKLQNGVGSMNQAILDAVLTTIEDAVITFDGQGRITSWNQAAERIFGYTPDEAIGRPSTLIIDPEGLAEERYIQGQILQGKVVRQLETLRERKDGSQIPVAINVSPVRNTEGIIIGTVKVLREVAERRLASEKQAILAAIIATSDDAIVSKTLQGVITNWNLAAERLFGYTEQEAIGQHISLIIPPDRLGEEDFIIGQIAQGKKVDHFETIRMTKDGREVHISVTVSPVIDATGKIIGASKVARDISVNRQLGEKQGMLAAIISSSDDTIVSKTLEGKITSWNRAAERMFGYTEAEAIGQHISLIIPPDRLNEETYIIGQVSKGQPVDHFETVRVAKDGRLIPISLSVSPIVDERGQIIGASKIARDISDHLAVQQEKARLYDEIKALNDKKDEFIGLASHELKTPLTSIQGYLQILNGDLNEDRRKEFLRRAGQQVKKLNGLVSDLLDISKIQAGQLRFNFAIFDLCQITQDAVELIASANNEFRIHLHTSAENILLNGDAQRIEQVILNLLTNAVRYSNGGRDIEVFVDMKDDLAKVSVKDQGIGIAPDQISQIFTRFYRVSENKNVSGLGLGLYLSQQIITRHQGQIGVESEPGKGSLFYFTLPTSKI